MAMDDVLFTSFCSVPSDHQRPLIWMTADCVEGRDRSAVPAVCKSDGRSLRCLWEGSKARIHCAGSRHRRHQRQPKTREVAPINLETARRSVWLLSRALGQPITVLGKSPASGAMRPGWKVPLYGFSRWFDRGQRNVQSQTTCTDRQSPASLR